MLNPLKWLAQLGSRAETKSVSGFLTGSDLDEGGSAAKLSSPYSQSAWVYIAVTRLAEKISQLPFRISRMDSAKARRVRALKNSADPAHRSFVRRAMSESIIESGDAFELFERPHPHMSRQLFWEMVVTWNCLRGEFFIAPLDNSDAAVDLSTRSPRVQRMLTLAPEMFWHVVQGYELAAWRFTGSPQFTPLPSEMWLPSEVVHSRNPNPYLFWRGMSPLSVAMVAAGADFAAAKYNQGYWLNNADTGLIVSSEQWPTDEQRAAVLAALRERKRKAGTPDRPMFLGGGTKVEKPTLSGMESQFVENRKMNRQEIGAIYKVSDAIMGFSAATALSGGDAKKSEEQSFIENTIMPLAAHLEAAVEPIVKSFGEEYIGWFDVWSLPVMQEAQRLRLDAGVKAFAIGVAFNDINAVYDLGFPDYKWGKKSFLPFSLQEVGADGLDKELPAETPDTADTAAEKGNPFSRMQNLLRSPSPSPGGEGRDEGELKSKSLELWKSHIAARRAAINLFESKAKRVINEFRGSTLAKLSEIMLGKDYDPDQPREDDGKWSEQGGSSETGTQSSEGHKLVDRFGGDFYEDATVEDERHVANELHPRLEKIEAASKEFAESLTEYREMQRNDPSGAKAFIEKEFSKYSDKTEEAIKGLRGNHGDYEWFATGKHSTSVGWSESYYLNVEVVKGDNTIYDGHLRISQHSSKNSYAAESRALRTKTESLKTAAYQIQTNSRMVGGKKKYIKRRSIVDLIFDAFAFGHELKAVLTNPTKVLLDSATEDLLKEIGLDGDAWKMPPKKVLTFLESRTQEVVGVGETMRDLLNTTLEEGVEAGETTKELGDRIRSAFNDIAPMEARRIAATEVNMAYNFSRQEAMASNGIEFKSWLSSHGPNVRMAHQLAEEQYLNHPIPISDPFVVGGEQLMFPGDDSFGASAGNIINCQCIQLAARAVSEDATTAMFKIFGIGEMKFSKS